MNSINRWEALTAATVTVPASIDRAYPAERLLVGIGQFTAVRAGRRWAFRRRARAIAAGTPESTLLRDLGGERPVTLVGWNVDRVLMPTLAGAAARALPGIAQHTVACLQRLTNGAVVDLAVGRHGSIAPNFATYATEMAVYAPIWSEGVIFNDWATGMVADLRCDLADEAVALWRVFVRTAGIGGVEAEAATDAWLANKPH